MGDERQVLIGGAVTAHRGDLRKRRQAEHTCPDRRRANDRIRRGRSGFRSPRARPRDPQRDGREANEQGRARRETAAACAARAVPGFGNRARPLGHRTPRPTRQGPRRPRPITDSGASWGVASVGSRRAPAPRPRERPLPRTPPPCPKTIARWHDGCFVHRERRYRTMGPLEYRVGESGFDAGARAALPAGRRPRSSSASVTCPGMGSDRPAGRPVRGGGQPRCRA